MNITTLGIDIAKNVFHLHGTNKEGKVELKKGTVTLTAGLRRFSVIFCTKRCLRSSLDADLFVLAFWKSNSYNSDASSGG